MPIPTARQRDLVTRVLGCPAVNDLEGLLQLGVDAVTIAAPTHLHHDIALTCIARGIHVLVEKPIASTVEEGREHHRCGEKGRRHPRWSATSSASIPP